jgi:hypothetical protein
MRTTLGARGPKESNRLTTALEIAVGGACCRGHADAFGHRLTAVGWIPYMASLPDACLTDQTRQNSKCEILKHPFQINEFGNSTLFFEKKFFFAEDQNRTSDFSLP